MRTPAAALAVALCLVACNANSTQLPVTETALAGVAPTGAGIYVARTRPGGALPDAMVVIQVGPSGQCPGFADISLTNKRPPNGRGTYAAPLVVTTFEPNANGVAVAANSTLGGSLGKLRLTGEIENRELKMQYSDARGVGAATGYFAGRCGGLRSSNPPDAAFIATWELYLAASTTGLPVAKTHLSIEIAGVSAGPNGSLLLNGTLSTNTPVTPNPPYFVVGSFKDGMLKLYAVTNAGPLGFAQANFNPSDPSTAYGIYQLGSSTVGVLTVAKKST